MDSDEKPRLVEQRLLKEAADPGPLFRAVTTMGPNGFRGSASPAPLLNAVAGVLEPRVAASSGAPGVGPSAKSQTNQGVAAPPTPPLDAPPQTAPSKSSK